VCRLPCRICENAVDQNVFHLSTACQFPVERRVYRGDRGKSTGTAVNIPAADAQIDSPDNPEANYNAGLACYRLEKYDEAISAFQRAASGASQDLEAKCHYNIGNCLFRQGKLKESLESYKRANELDRDDEDTKANIEYVTRLMKELASQQKDEQEQQQEEQEQKAQPKELEDQKEAEELIRKALERSDEHEAEKKARMRKMPLSPNERDW